MFWKKLKMFYDFLITVYPQNNLMQVGKLFIENKFETLLNCALYNSYKYI